MSPDSSELEGLQIQQKKLRYQGEIDRLKLAIVCPDNLSPINSDLEAFRFCHDPIDVSKDFLPNVIYDQIVGIAFDYTDNNKDEKKKCLRCGASFYNTEDSILARWNNMAPQVKENLGYSTIAKGILSSGDGLITEAKRGHFGFYEYEGAAFHGSFKIIEVSK